MMKRRILIVDDHQLVRQGLRHLLEASEQFEVVSEAPNGRKGVDLARELTPDIVVMDLSMPDLNGFDATRQLLASNPSAKVICLTAFAGERAISDMLKAGATGFVLKEAAFEELVVALQTVLRGEVYLSPPIARMVVDGLVTGPDGRRGPGGSVVSAREREVLQLISEGQTVKTIAMKLHLSTKTIESHRRNLMEKLKIDSVAELTKYAVREGITSL